MRLPDYYLAPLLPRATVEELVRDALKAM